VKKLSKYRPNPDNPRTITDLDFERLKKNVKEFEKMLAIRPIIVDKTGIVIGGNSKYRALLALGYVEVPNEWIQSAGDLTEEERRRFIMLDNHHAGKDDWDAIANMFDQTELVEWGIDIPEMDGPPTVNFNASPAKGLKIKITAQTGEQVEQITALCEKLGITEVKIR
jgi:hypothetical protein